MRTRMFVLFLLSLSTATLGAGARLEMKVSPAISFEPAYLTVRASVDASDENRMLEVIAESDDYYRSTQIPLAGAQAPRTTLVSFRSLPSGTYKVKVIVRGSHGQLLLRSVQSASVVNRTGERD